MDLDTVSESARLTVQNRRNGQCDGTSTWQGRAQREGPCTWEGRTQHESPLPRGAGSGHWRPEPEGRLHVWCNRLSCLSEDPAEKLRGTVVASGPLRHTYQIPRSMWIRQPRPLLYIQILGDEIKNNCFWYIFQISFLSICFIYLFLNICSNLATHRQGQCILGKE